MKFPNRLGVGLTTVLAVLLAAKALAAPMGVREAAQSLERQLKTDPAASPRQAFTLALSGTGLVLTGEATLQALDQQQCRRTVELVHDKPFERHGLRITHLSRRSVQDGPCHHIADAMAAQAEASAKSIAEQTGFATTPANTAPVARALATQVASVTPVRLNESTPTPATAVALTVLEKAIIRDAPSKQGEKLSRADVGTRLKAWRIAGNADWFVLDGGLRFISASVVDVNDAGSSKAPAQTDASRIRLKVMERAVLRNAPSFKGKKVAQLAAGVERLARKVPGMADWFELADSESRYPLYIHESVVTQKPSDKRL